MSIVSTIEKAVVIGAGAMGSGIAAQLANAGVSVYLLDIVPEGAKNRNILAENAIERMLKASPATDPLNAGLMTRENAAKIKAGNIHDHLEQAARDADWLVEVVVENIQIKRNLYARIETLVRPEAILSSNTSTIPLKDLIQDRSENFQKQFIITHFFNPPRFMHLLEIVTGPTTNPEISAFMRQFGEKKLGKNVIECKDTPAFLANRIGIYFMFRAITEAIDRQMKIEEVDAVLGSPIGFPKEGIFGLLDLVGISIIPLVTESLLKTLPDDDPFRFFDHEKGLNLVHTLLSQGCTGRNADQGGFYRLHKSADDHKKKQVISLKNSDYYDVEKVKLPSIQASKTAGPKAIFEARDDLSRFAWVVVRDTLLYAARLIPEISDDIVDVDAALRGGYNAKWGPFEQIDQLGVEWFSKRVIEDGLALPETLKIAGNRSFYEHRNGKYFRLIFDFKNKKADYQEINRTSDCLKLSEIKLQTKPLIKHYSGSLWDIGDGIVCLEFHSKMNTIDPSILWVINRSIQFVKNNKNYCGMVFYNEAKNFSLGANIGLVDAALKTAKLPFFKTSGLSGFFLNKVYFLTELLIYQGQSIFNALKYAPFPVVGAPNGMALGGGCEILLHCDRIQANAETYMGLVESGVGLIPGWGGCVQFLVRCKNASSIKKGAMAFIREAFQAILMPQLSISTSAQHAQNKNWLAPTDRITMNPDYLLADAKKLALTSVIDYQPMPRVQYKLPGRYGLTMLNMAVDDFYVKGDATWHDVIVADALATVLTGDNIESSEFVDENTLYQLEREAFLSLLKMEQTQNRIAHTLKTGKPLREEPLEPPISLEAIRQSRQKQKNYKIRVISGQPLEGWEGFQLRLFAEVSAILLKLANKK